jgi:cyclophilin family peptidyl-prolyl cis-trans isomerase
MKANFTVCAALAAACPSVAAFATDVAVCTDQGRFVIELADAQTPKHVENFLRYVDMSFYAGSVFHRVLPGALVQGGGLDRNLRARGPTLPPVPNESAKGATYARGAVAAARQADPNSATSQFFVVLGNDAKLDESSGGYTVFGRVTEGIEVVDAIGKLPTGPSGPLKADVPMPLVVIGSVARLDAAALAALPQDGREAAIKERVTAALAAQSHEEALRWVDHYRASCGAPDSEISVAEARAALALSNADRATFVLEEFFATAAREDPSYEAATAIYNEALQKRQQNAALVADDCDPPPVPQVPNGASATIEQMVAGQNDVKKFVSAGEAYLACLAKLIDDKDRRAEDRNAAIAEHNRMVSAMEQSAADFNSQIRAFKAKN